MTSASGSQATYWLFRERLEEDCASVVTGGRALGEVSGNGAETNIVVIKDVMAWEWEVEVSLSAPEQ